MIALLKLQVAAILVPRQVVVVGAVRIRHVFEHAHLALLKHVCHIVGVNGRVTPALVVEAALSVQVVEVVQIGSIAKDRKSCQLEIRVENAHAIDERLAVVVGYPSECVARRRVLSRSEPMRHARPESGQVGRRLARAKHEAVGAILPDHCGEWIALERTREDRVVVDSHKVVVFEHGWMAKEEARVEATHVSVGERLARLVQARMHSLLAQPAGHRPKLLGNEGEVNARASQIENAALENGRELVTIEEHVRIAIFAVEVALEVGHCLGKLRQVLVANKHNNARFYRVSRMIRISRARQIAKSKLIDEQQETVEHKQQNQLSVEHHHHSS